MKRLIYTAFFLMITAFLLFYPSVGLAFSLNGLHLWFQKMVPSLLPFMILSGMMIRLNLTDKIIFLFRPLLQPLFHLRSEAIYALVAGFLCGFPMGARVVADLYGSRRITKSEAGYLLAFCNNIGPIYFTGFVLPALALKKTMPFLIGMYGIPLAYGIFLRYTFYRNRLPAVTAPPLLARPPMGLPEALDDSVTAGMEGITKLGGYMIFFNLLNIVPFILLKENRFSALWSSFLEITGGIQAMGSSHPALSLILLSFGGLSCLAQTNSCIRQTDLSIYSYLMHKLILTLLTGGYYMLLLFFSAL